jgi:hypothetical protein
MMIAEYEEQDSANLDAMKQNKNMKRGSLASQLTNVTTPCMKR